MRVGVPKEIKDHEYRVGLMQAAVREAVARGHAVRVESGAGLAIGYDDESYRASGAAIVEDAEAVFGWAEFVVKVKEPQPVECRRLREGQVLFTYLHLAGDPEHARLLIESGCTAISYETVTDASGRRPMQVAWAIALVDGTGRPRAESRQGSGGPGSNLIAISGI